jgi:hypothetical protein
MLSASDVRPCAGWANSSCKAADPKLQKPGAQCSRFWSKLACYVSVSEGSPLPTHQLHFALAAVTTACSHWRLLCVLEKCPPHRVYKSQLRAARTRCGALDNPLDLSSASLRWGPLELSGAVGGTHRSDSLLRDTCAVRHSRRLAWHDRACHQKLFHPMGTTME